MNYLNRISRWWDEKTNNYSGGFGKDFIAANQSTEAPKHHPDKPKEKTPKESKTPNTTAHVAVNTTAHTEKSLLEKLLDEKKDKYHAEKSKQFQDYYFNKSKKVFPNEYDQTLNGSTPKQNPIKTYLTSTPSNYMSGLPKLAYERQIDVDRKYVREGHYIYGA
jgi:hypothetical protein